MEEGLQGVLVIGCVLLVALGLILKDIFGRGEPRIGNLLIAHWLATVNDRSWEICIPLIFGAKFQKTLRPIAIFGLGFNLTNAIGLPVMGSWLDRNRRWDAQKASLTGLHLCILATSTIFVASEELEGVAFVLLVVLASFGGLMNATRTISLEKDVVVVVAEAANIPLSHLNATLRRIDLVAKSAAPAAFGLLFASFSPETAVPQTILTLSIMSLVSWPIEMFALRSLFNDFGDELEAKMHSHEGGIMHKHRAGHKPHAHPILENETVNEEILLEEENLENTERKISRYVSNGSNFSDLLRKILRFFSHRVFFAALAHSMLFLTVLDGSFLVTQFLLNSSVSSRVVGFFRGLGAFFGLMGTFLFAFVKDRFGLLRTGSVAIWTFWIILFPVGVLFADNAGAHLVGTSLTILLAVSRMFLWCYDIAVVEIFQSLISEEDRGVFNSIQTGMCNLFVCIIQIIGIQFHRIDQFEYLIYISLAVVFSAASIFSVWSVCHAWSSGVQGPRYETLEMT